MGAGVAVSVIMETSAADTHQARTGNGPAVAAVLRNIRNAASGAG